MKTQKEAKRQGSAVTRGRVALAGGATLGIVAFLMVMAPFASAGALFYQRAPFGTAQTVQLTNTIVRGPGAGVMVLVTPSFSAARGVAFGHVSAVVTSTVGAPAMAAFKTTLGIGALPFTSGAGGPSKLTVGWTVGFTAQLKAMHGAFPMAPGLVAQVVVRATTYLVEPTTGLPVAGSAATVTIWSQALTGGQLLYGQGGQLYQFGPAPVSLTASHTYAVYTVIQVDLTAIVGPGALPGSSVLASINLLGPGTSLSFVSVR